MASCLLTLPQVASAQPATCTGNDATELVAGCSALGSADFSVKLFVPEGTAVDTDANVREALNTTLVFVHGYGVTDTALPSVLFEDGNAGVLEELLASGVSILSMAPGDSGDDRVEDDAEALRTALELLNAYRTAEAGKLVVLGHSMGGLAARIALAEMEADASEHEVALYISYDSPHGGVNVPQGMQNLKVKLDEWATMREADFVAIDPRMGRGLRPGHIAANHVQCWTRMRSVACRPHLDSGAADDDSARRTTRGTRAFEDLLEPDRVSSSQERSP